MSANPFTSKTPEGKAGRNVFRKVPECTMSLMFRFSLSRDGRANWVHAKQLPVMMLHNAWLHHGLASSLIYCVEQR